MLSYNDEKSSNDFDVEIVGEAMKGLSKNIKLLCPLCGNDQFESLDVSFDDLRDSPDDVQIKCTDCQSVYTKSEIIEENQGLISANIEQFKKEALKELDKKLKKILRK